MFSLMAVQVYISTNSVQEFSFLHVLANTCYFVLFGDSRSDMCEPISHCVFFEICFCLIYSRAGSLLLQVGFL